MTTHLSYRALAVQFKTMAVNKCNGRDEARAEMDRSIERLANQIPAAKSWIGPDLRLVVVPEYFLTGFPMGDPIDVWADKAGLEVDGPEYEKLSKIAQDNDIYLSGNVYEQDVHFPGIYFQCNFIIAPSGDVILRYRRLLSMFSPSPYDFLDKYLEIYGEDALFPVADTEIGKLGCISSEEVLYPEMVRCTALNGAEVFCHSSSEVGSLQMTPKNIAKRARAIENLAYIVSANSAGIYNYDMGAGSTDGHSQIVDYMGLVLIEAGAGESHIAFAEIDLAAVRRYRSRPGMFNILSRQPTDLYARQYAKTQIYPPNLLINDDGTLKHPQRSFFIERQQGIIEKMKERGIIEE